jgi:hypothetical protein
VALVVLVYLVLFLEQQHFTQAAVVAVEKLPTEA